MVKRALKAENRTFSLPTWLLNAVIELAKEKNIGVSKLVQVFIADGLAAEKLEFQEAASALRSIVQQNHPEF